MRGLRDLLPLIMPLLITALERAMQLAESMEAHGFGRQLAPISLGRRASQQGALLLGLAALGVGMAGVGFWPERHLLVGLLLAGGGLLVGLSFWDQGRRVARSHYRRWLWSQAGYALLAINGLVSVAWLGVWLARGNDWLLYYPYPPYSPWPTFVPWVGLLAVLPVVSGLLLPEAGSSEPETGNWKLEAGDGVVPAQGLAVEPMRPVAVEDRPFRAEGAAAPARWVSAARADTRPRDAARGCVTPRRSTAPLRRLPVMLPVRPRLFAGGAWPWALITRLLVALLVIWRR